MPPRHLRPEAPSEFPVPAYGAHDLEPARNLQVWQPPVLARPEKS
jgi:NADH-quinone oxidoreductase subunit B